MPLVRIQILEGRTVQQKRDVAKKVTDVISESLDVSKEAVTIVIEDLPCENLAVAGELRIDKK